jgi:hypothetical protein
LSVSAYAGFVKHACAHKVSLRDKTCAALIRHALRAQGMRYAYVIHDDFSNLIHEVRVTSSQQPQEVTKKGRSPANLLIQFHLHLIFKPTWRAHPCAHQALSRPPVWPFDKAQMKSGKLESR